MLVGTAQWSEGSLVRKAVVAPLPSDPERLVDLNQVERVRLAKMGEGRAEDLAETLVPTSLRRVLEGGFRAVNRLRQALAYADKWHNKTSLPESLAPRLENVRLLSCIPRPAALRRFDGTYLDRMSIHGPGSVVHEVPAPTLALVGQYPGRPAGVCIAMEDSNSTVIGAWLSLDTALEGALSLRRQGEDPRETDVTIWQDLEIPSLLASEIFLLPPPVWKPLPTLVSGARFEVATAFETLHLRLGKDSLHPTVQ
jgi:hypothetical protein